MHCRLNTQPFGSARAPANWARMINAFSFIMLHLFALWIAIYVDDCYNIEPDGTAQSALGALNGLAKVPGLALAPDKQAGPTITALLLGANISLEQRLIRAEQPKLKAQSIIQDIELMMKNNCLSAADDAKLRGAALSNHYFSPVSAKNYRNR